MIGMEEEIKKCKELQEKVLLTVIRITRENQVCKWNHESKFRQSVLGLIIRYPGGDVK